MSIDERKRHALYERLDDVLDEAHADTLMELLPPVGWADVATKRDLDLLGNELDLKLEAMEARLTSRFAAELHGALRQHLWAILGALLMAVILSEVVSRLG